MRRCEAESRQDPRPNRPLPERYAPSLRTGRTIPHGASSHAVRVSARDSGTMQRRIAAVIVLGSPVYSLAFGPFGVFLVPVVTTAAGPWVWPGVARRRLAMLGATVTGTMIVVYFLAVFLLLRPWRADRCVAVGRPADRPARVCGRMPVRDTSSLAVARARGRCLVGNRCRRGRRDGDRRSVRGMTKRSIPSLARVANGSIGGSKGLVSIEPTGTRCALHSTPEPVAPPARPHPNPSGASRRPTIQRSCADGVCSTRPGPSSERGDPVPRRIGSS